MKNIKIKILNPSAITDTYKMMVAGARLTQHSHELKSLEDFEKMYDKPLPQGLINSLNKLPHPTLLHFTKINVVVFGASRRFLAQITRHQENVKFMSGSLQYSNFAGDAEVVVPYNLIGTDYVNSYIDECKNAMSMYKKLQNEGNIDNDSAGYVTPQGLRNILIISATPYQWKHMISQRVCRRNTLETRYVMLLIWNELYNLAPDIFTMDTTGPFCMQTYCREGKMSCGKLIQHVNTPADILYKDFPKLWKEIEC